MPRHFLTVSEELLEHADCVADFFENHGYAVKVEHAELGFPYTPTLWCRRAPTKMLVEVDAVVHRERLTTWAAYARSCNRDTRIALALPHTFVRQPDDDAKLRELGIGLYVSDGTVTTEIIAPLDMPLNVQLPDLATLPLKTRRVLGPVYEQFQRSQWREGFEEACQAVEVHARRYLAKSIETGRVSLVNEQGRPRSLTRHQIDKLTLGALGEAFGQFQNQNHADAAIAKVLMRINSDRIGVVHHKGKAATEARLRKNVGHHMWSVIAALKELL